MTATSPPGDARPAPRHEPGHQPVDESPQQSAGLRPLAGLVGAHLGVACIDGTERPYRDLDCAASTPASLAVADAVNAFLPEYSSVHRGAGYKSRASTMAYEMARQAILTHCGRSGDDIAVICRNTTEALNQLAYRLALGRSDVVLTTVVEHHANLLPWGRYAERRYVECAPDGTFGIDDVVAGLEAEPRPALLAVTGASNVTGWLPPIDQICDAAHERGVAVVLDAAQLAPHHRVPSGPDFVAFSGHKMYAPFGAGVLVGPRSAFATGEPFLAGGGAVDLVDLDEVIWSRPPEREEAGSPNVVGAVALGVAIDQLRDIGWDAVATHEAALGHRLRQGLAAIDGVRLLGPGLRTDTLAVATFVVEGLHHGLVAARLSAEWGIGVRHGCFCAHPYLLRLLGLGAEDVAAARAHVLGGDRRAIPGAVRASAGIGTTLADVETLLGAVAEIASGSEPPVPYVQDSASGDYYPQTAVPGWWTQSDEAGGGCART